MSLTKLRIKNFKGLSQVEIPLEDSVVFVGPNNSGKTTALQALTLWAHGLSVWLSRRKGGKATEKAGVTINRRDLTHIPVRDSRDLWNNLTVSRMENGKQVNVNIEIEVEGVDDATDERWGVGLRFYRANSESIYCQPLRANEPIHAGAERTHIALMPPMSGLSPEEPEVTRGRIDVLVGRGQTAEVLRNICLQVQQQDSDAWGLITARMKELFGVEIGNPQRDTARGEVTLTFRDRAGTELDLVSSGRGQQQVLLLLAHLHLNPKSILLLDEPDAHLEILRQRQVYSLVTETAKSLRSQVIVASHSEVVLTEAAEKDVIIGFIGNRPHRIDDRGSQLRKSLSDIGFEDYYLAESTRFVLYLEGSTDLAMLRAWSGVLNHDAKKILARPFVKYIANQPNKASEHFFGLKEGIPSLMGFALFDHLGRELPPSFKLDNHQWRKNEIENYIVNKDVLLRFVRGEPRDDLIERALSQEREEAFMKALADLEAALATLGKPSVYSDNVKASTEVLEPLFKNYARIRGVQNSLSKSDFFEIAASMKPDEIDGEVVTVLDALVSALQEK
jgi:ABC-type lipoprotein export system ATPase subunit